MVWGKHWALNWLCNGTWSMQTEYTNRVQTGADPLAPQWPLTSNTCQHVTVIQSFDNASGNQAAGLGSQGGLHTTISQALRASGLPRIAMVFRGPRRQKSRGLTTISRENFSWVNRWFGDPLKHRWLVSPWRLLIINMRGQVNKWSHHCSCRYLSQCQTSANNLEYLLAMKVNK